MSYPFFHSFFPFLNIWGMLQYQYVYGNVGRLNSACYSNTAICHALDDFSVGEKEGNLMGIGRREGIDFLRLMEERGIRANYHTYLWLLEGCLNSGSLIDGKKLHGRILKSGFDGEEGLCSQLVDIYVAHGYVDEAVKVFDDMPDRGTSSWNKIIFGFVAWKLTGRVMGFFSRMLNENVIPDETTFANVLRACGGGKVAFYCIEQIHAKIIRHGFGTSLLVCNPLIDLYSKNGFVDSAKLVFDKLFLRDNISWVAMISGLSQNGHEDEAILLFCQMHKSGIIPTPYVLSSCLSACSKIELFKLGELLHALTFKWGFSSETFVCNALVTLYSRGGNLLSC
ncbi:hypothetical protein L1049_009489 [Liquidambar formosana]|uniref:Pentatricopeptide repeat-containing protein n=1 Tax=Liquidambar formosana TaxID=63359 RepID=A0AAP0S9E3_LIQFO